MGVIWDYIWGYMGLYRVIWGYIISYIGLYSVIWGYIRIIEKKMETMI